MHLFQEYIQPLTSWLYAHPHLALFVTFIISFSESLAIIGSIVPGSITMTTIGILAGAGIMRIDLTYIAATLGAIAGDGVSYALGYVFSDRLTNLWPFSRYPNWVNYGKDFFARHGGASVLIGRFFGPMRSLIPVIAGMLHMNRWHFFLANATSAIGWAILYVSPGVLIGIASNDLSAESATRLFILTLLLLIVVWLASLGIKWLFKYTNQFLKVGLHQFWVWCGKHRYIGYYCRRVTPKHEVCHYSTAALTLLLKLCFLISVVLIVLVIQESWVAFINQPILLFLQSLRTQYFDSFFIIISLIISPLPLLTLLISFSIYLIFRNDWRTLCYWISLASTSALVIFTLASQVLVPTPAGTALHQVVPFFPDINLTFATSLFGFFIFYINRQVQTITVRILNFVLLFLWFLTGLASLYLGDNWFSGVMAAYFIGLTLCLVHWIFYRCGDMLKKQAQTPIAYLCLLVVVAACLSGHLSYKRRLHAHFPYLEHYIVLDNVWWNQQQPLLPVYSTNRVGKPVGLLNIQYVGSIKALQRSLEHYGWKQQSDSLLYALLLRAGGDKSAKELPLVTQLYQNNKPTIVMTYSVGHKQNLLVLRLWRSNYKLQNNHQPIWIGSVHPHLRARKIKNKGIKPQLVDPQRPILDALPKFQFNRMSFPHQTMDSLPQQTVPPILLIIKEPAP